MSRNVVRRLRGKHFIMMLAAMVALIVYIACSNDATYAPLGNDKPKSGEVVSGSVLEPGQGAVKGAVVSIEALTNGVPQSALALKDNPELASKSDKPATSDAAGRVTLTDEKGRFYFDGLAPGDYAVQVRANDHLGGFANMVVPNTPQTVDTIIVNVNLTPTGTFSGVATLENGALVPTAHANIVVYCQGSSYVAVTDATGAYAITDVPVGTYTIRATKSHYLDDSKIGTLTFAGQNLGLPAMLLKIDNNIAPVATISIAAQPMVQNTPISFQASGSDLDGSVVKYEWDWENDGTMDASSAAPGFTNHTYTTAGTYIVKLRVTDNLGAIGLDAKTITVASAAIYMATTGADHQPGTAALPVLTLNKAYALATAAGITKIRAGSGTYVEVPIFANGIDIEGGYDATWTPDTGYTTFQMGNARAKANSITSPTTIHRVQLNASAAPAGSNSVALLSQGCTLALVFDTCIFKSGNGGAGTPGAAGNVGIPGGGGNVGLDGACDTNGPGGPGGTGGASPVCMGGAGGQGGANGANPGQPGSPAPCAGGAPGGPGGPSGDPGQTGQPGGPGANGSYGAVGAAGANTGTIVGNDWAPFSGGNGVVGTDGKGGGGGGGGGGQFCTFCDDGQGNGGGGGGGAATAGTGGGGGTGGYGSITVLLINSSPTFQSCTMTSTTGGAGAAGGAGGDGGIGGTGGFGGAKCTGEVGKGGQGGKGGDGGGGGGGAGGAGGPSICIIKASGSLPVLNAIIYNNGFGGSGGIGGLTGKLSGVNGPTAPTGPVGLQALTVTM